MNEGLKVICEHPSARVTAMAKQLPEKTQREQGLRTTAPELKINGSGLRTEGP